MATPDTTHQEPSSVSQAAQHAKEKAKQAGAKAKDDLSMARDAVSNVTSLRSVIMQTVFAVLGVVAILIVAATFFKEPLTLFADWMVAQFGLAGILLGIAASDILSIPIPPDTFIFFAATSDMPALPVVTAMSLTSVICGNIAYFVGPQVQRIGFIRRRIEKWRPKGEALFLRWGVWAVAIGAISPLPYAMTCWFAGIYKMPYKKFFLATFTRIPRIVAYYYLFVLGWI